ncbi:extensin family protein [Pseudomonas sp. BN414]|uniref:extensin-like domain-containing protein n=1 Tax=Pseudomonas sp. BN414 TaxID=2567888 RepID=UPI002455F542|nr:extensin family protein [Pseudomonas sp. BN414]
MALLLAPTLERGWRLELPPRWNPWAPLDVRDAPNLVTRFKLSRLQGDRELCRLALTSSPLRYAALPDSAPVAGCPLSNSVRISASDLTFSSSFISTCELAVAFALFERHSLQPTAQQIFGQRVVRIDHLGSFACRNIGDSQRRSQHAAANALDIAGFRLADGRHISVARDWAGDGDNARFLREVLKAACEHFSVTLGPDYNAAHRDHFHLDMGLFHMCR